MKIFLAEKAFERFPGTEGRGPKLPKDKTLVGFCLSS